MVAAYHLLWTIYGYWLPNDPRGSMSSLIRDNQIAQLGPSHFERKTVQPAKNEMRAFRDQSAKVLKHELRDLSPNEVTRVATSLGDEIRERGYTCYACAIMPDHVHLLIRKHRHTAETMVAELQRASRMAVLDVGERLLEHPVWGGPGWKVFLRTRDDIERVVRYIARNPEKAKLPA
jgi:REP element-mobilizing transposase RayT